MRKKAVGSQRSTIESKNLKILQHKLAFQAAVCARTCPSDSALRLEDNVTLTHLKRCPLCQERLEMLNEGIFNYSLEPSLTKTGGLVEPGGLYRVAEELGGWGEDCKYYNPPIVLVVNTTLGDPHISAERRVRVVQTWCDKLLMGPDDLPLGKEHGFAEPWNSYTLDENECESLVGTVSEQVLAAVRKALSNDFLEISINSVLFGFRTLELAVGSFIARRSLEKHLEEREGNQRTAALPFPTGKELLDFIAARRPDVALPKDGADPYEILLGTRFPEVEYKLAAAPEMGWRVATLLLVSGSNLDVIGAYYKITSTEDTEQGAFVTGKIRKGSPLVREIHGCWASKAGSYSRAKTLDLDPENGLFRVLFPNIMSSQLPKGEISFLFLSDG